MTRLADHSDVPLWGWREWTLIIAALVALLIVTRIRAVRRRKNTRPAHVTAPAAGRCQTPNHDGTSVCGRPAEVLVIKDGNRLADVCTLCASEGCVRYGWIHGGVA